MELEVTPFIKEPVEKYSLIFRKISRDELLSLIFSHKKDKEGKYLYITGNEYDSFLFRSYQEKNCSFQLKVISPILIDDIPLKKYTLIKLLPSFSLYHVHRDISISKIEKVIETIILSLSRDYRNFAVVRPKSLSEVIDKISTNGRCMFNDNIRVIPKNIEFIIDCMLDENLEYITYPEAISRVYDVQNNNPGANYFRLITETTFTKLRTKKGNPFSLFYPYIEEYNDILNKMGIKEKIQIGEYQMDLYPTIIMNKIPYNFEATLLSITMNNPELISDFVDYRLSHIDNMIDNHNKREISKFLYNKYGSNSFINFYVEIMKRCYSLPHKKLIDFASLNYIDEDSLLRLRAEMRLIIGDKKYNSNIEKLRDVILQLFQDKIMTQIDQRTYTDGKEIYSITDNNIYSLYPTKLIPLVVKNNIIYLYQEL